MSVGGYLPPEVEGEPQPVLLVRAYVNQLAEIVQRTADRAEAIHTSTRLSEEGKAVAFRELAEQAFGEIERSGFARQAEEEYQRHAASLDDALAAAVPAAESPAAVQIAAEIRQMLLTASGSDRLAMLDKHKGDPAFAAAVLTAPPYLSGISPEHYGSFRQQALAAIAPGKHAGRALIERFHSEAGRATRNASAVIFEATGTERRPDGSIRHPREPRRG